MPRPTTSSRRRISLRSMRSRTPSDETREPHRRARDDSGLTTLEWLLIVAAVAGLAALAVVLVQNVVSDTSEQIAGSSARKTAAQVAALQIMRDADRDGATQPDSADTYGEWITHYAAKCDRIEITFADVPDISVTANFAIMSTLTAAGVPAAAVIAQGDVKATTNTSAAANNAIAECRVP